MAAWASPSSSYGANSPFSPLTPPSPNSLPQWLRASTRPRSVIAPNSRLKLLLVCALCVGLGWMVTSSLGPSQDSQNTGAGIYDSASAGVLDSPSGFGSIHKPEKRPGIIDDAAEGDGGKHSKNLPTPQSVSGALADLHHAVSSKIKSWNPYFNKSPNDRHVAANQTLGKSANPALAGESIHDGIKEADRLGARIRIGKATVLFHGNEFWERCIRTHEQHDRHHGYRLHVLRQELMDDVWSKPAYILSVLLRELAKPQSERLDWLFWADSDTIIMNPYIPIEIFLPPPGTEFDDVYLMYSRDWNGLNNGVFPIRVNQWAVNLFSAIVSYRHFNPAVPLQFRDQSAMNNLMQEREFAQHIIQAPQRWFNAYQGEHNETLQPFQVRRGDLLVHFAGVFPREERMQFWLERAEQHFEEWEVPVKSTSYPEEAREFWREQKGIRKDKAQKLQQVVDEANKLLSITDQHLKEYGFRLNGDQQMNIAQQLEMLKKLLDQSTTKDDPAKITEGIRILTDSAGVLTSQITEANKMLLQAAHEAIFGAEKDLLEGGFGEGRTSPELELISERVKNLKTIIMTPEETWNREAITSATNALTEARAKQQEVVAARIAEQQRVNDELAAQGQPAAPVEAPSATTVSDAVGDVSPSASLEDGMGTTVSTDAGSTSSTVEPAATVVLPIGAPVGRR